MGVFGYFPTYALGNIYCAALFAAMRRDLPDLDGRLSEGDLTPALVWLRENIHRHGRLKGPVELVVSVTGAPPSITPILAYLEEKYATLFDL